MKMRYSRMTNQSNQASGPDRIASGGSGPAIRRTTISLDADLVHRCRPYGSQTNVLEAALRAFLAQPDPAVPRTMPVGSTVVRVHVDPSLLPPIKRFAIDQAFARRQRVTQRAVVEDILRSYLDRLDAQH
jgi:hypothetical protein